MKDAFSLFYVYDDELFLGTFSERKHALEAVDQFVARADKEGWANSEGGKIDHVDFDVRTTKINEVNFSILKEHVE